VETWSELSQIASYFEHTVEYSCLVEVKNFLTRWPNIRLQRRHYNSVFRTVFAEPWCSTQRYYAYSEKSWNK